MEECESLPEFQCEASDEDEVEELQNSLREVVQDPSVRPRLQCLMVDPSFSMVTVQSEDSGIVWETASSRCSTPWASETSSTSEAYSMEGSGAAGKITIVFDEEKIVRRRTRSGGRSSRLRDRLSRAGSSRSASALGAERPEMMEVSLPNVREEKSSTEADLEGLKSKDQQLFSLISEGYEILNIRVPSKLPTVDEEESTELQDNLSYLKQTSKIKSRNQLDTSQPSDTEHVTEEQPLKSKAETEVELVHASTLKDSSSDIDYFEKFTLLDETVPGEQVPEHQEEIQEPEERLPPEEPAKETPKDSSDASEEPFVIVTDVDINGEHLDEMFYGELPPADAPVDQAPTRTRRETERSTKENGSVLFGSEETILTPIFISPGPPKIIDPILLEEPTAMSFMYSDLYEDAVGDRRRSDEERSEAESVVSEPPYRRRFSDPEEAEGYLEKFTLKDDIPSVDHPPQETEDKRSDVRMMWPQSMFEMTGCLTRAVNEEHEERTKMKGAKIQEKSEDVLPPALDHHQDVSEDYSQEPPGMKGEDQQVMVELKTEQVNIPGTHQEDWNLGTKGTSKERQKEDEDEEKRCEEIVTPEGCEKVHVVTRPQTADVGSSSCEAEGVMVLAADEKMETEAEAPSPCELHPGDDAPVEVLTHCDGAVHTVVEVTETAVSGKESLTQVQIDLQDVTCVEPKGEKLRTEEATAEKVPQCLPEALQTEQEMDVKGEETQQEQHHITVTEHQQESVTEETLSLVQDIVNAGDEFVLLVPKGQAVEMDIEAATSDATATPQPEDKPELQTEEEDSKVDQHMEVESVTEETVSSVQDIVIAGDEFVLLVPKGQAVEMDIEAATSDATTTPKPEDKPELQTEEEDSKVYHHAEAKSVTEETVSSVQDIISAGDEFVPLVPKGQAVEMDIEAATSDATTTPKPEDKPELQTEEEDSKVYHHAEAKSVTEETVSSVQDIISAGDEFVPLVPKGQAVEMDIEAATSDATTTSQPEDKPELQTEEEDSKVDQHVEVEAEVPVKVQPVHECEEPAPPEELHTNREELERYMEKEEDVQCSLRSFTPLEDLSELQEDDVQTTKQYREEKQEDGPEAEIITEEAVQEFNLRKKEQRQTEEEEDALVKSEDVLTELEYEVIHPQEAEDIMEPEAQRATEEPEAWRETEEPGERETVLKNEEETEKEDMCVDEELMETDYDIIDAEEEREARLAAELQGMDWFCVPCGSLLTLEDQQHHSSQQDHSHQISSVDQCYEEIKETLSGWISELQERTENIEDLVSELELAYNSVEDQCVESEVAMQAQNEEMMALVMDQYNNMSVSMEEEKKAKLEQLYDQIVSFQESIDSAKATIESALREAETEARPPEDIQERLKAALVTASSLDLGPKGLLVFQDYAKANSSSSNLTQRKGIPVPQRPSLHVQEPGSATSTSVTVYWKVNPEDVIDCFQVYCMEDPQGAVSEEYRVTVKESYCVLEELEPDKMYKVWVMAVNYSGCSLPSDRLLFRTAPSVPSINTELCTVLWDSATLRWTSSKHTPGQSYTLEYCRQYEVEGEGLRSIAGISSCEHKVVLQPSESYLFYIKAVNEAGASEQSEAALVSTRGSRFQLLRESAHPAVELSEDGTTLTYSQDAHKAAAASDKQCPSILGELLPSHGVYYWETLVSRCAAYRVGVAYSSANRTSFLGENSLSWCLQCFPTPLGCRYQLLHGDIQSSVFFIDMPERVGTLLDYQGGRLSFYNAQSGQVIGTFRHTFTQPCHPALALELPGSLEISMVLEAPHFSKAC
ncbi:cardiomyopathy-associated protein 5 [Gouania willdenowi]|uniref:Cardiomyopathy-associated protein 5-like n=1 Tax=Gouania willdenowi TaxID=441366 RepID=A0A8C5DGC6_GOUWI|nr:cardiomyopathy-associated protein 5-like [Gouania willdenowi]